MAEERKSGNKRIVTNQDITNYDRMIEKWLRSSVTKNWTGSSVARDYDEMSLGNSGYTMSDMRQYLRMQVHIALLNYDPNYRTKEGKSVKESTFVFRHLKNRIGQQMVKFTKLKAGYGCWMSKLEDVLHETDRE